MDNQLITNSQYGFTTRLSSFHAIFDLLNEIFTELDKKLNVSFIFLDLATGFDIVDHKILLQKLNYSDLRVSRFSSFKAFELI